MPAWTAADVKFWAPEFSGVADATVDVYSAEAAVEFNEDFFGARAKRAGALLTAHMMTLYPPAGYTGSLPGLTGSAPVESISVDDVSVSYAQPTTQSAGSSASSRYELTKYGSDFLAMARQCKSAGFVTL